MTRAFVVTAMKELDRLGFGKFVVGRRGNQSRMIWNVGLGDLDGVLREKLSTSKSWSHRKALQRRIWRIPECRRSYICISFGRTSECLLGFRQTSHVGRLGDWQTLFCPCPLSHRLNRTSRKKATNTEFERPKGKE